MVLYNYLVGLESHFRGIFLPDFFIFEHMKAGLLSLLLAISLSYTAQDKIYLLNGESRTGKISDITYEKIIYQSGGSHDFVLIGQVLLVEYGNGKTEIFNPPIRDILFRPNEDEQKTVSPVKKDFFHQNMLSLNTLALCNADISLFYEYINSNKKFGYGIMGAYNFNLYVNPTNLYLASVSNAKKLYDVGVFLNYYPTQLKKRNNFTMGLLIKYCAFKFTSETIDPVSSLVTYSPSEGSQLAPMFQIGSHHIVSSNFFVKTILALGGMGLKGDFKQQFNYNLNSNNPGTEYNVRFLPKIYLGLNTGFNF